LSCGKDAFAAEAEVRIARALRGLGLRCDDALGAGFRFRIHARQQSL
jgi:hypothetical protein